MKNLRCFVACSTLVVLSTVFLTNVATAEEKKGKSKYACAEAKPASLCNAENACGSASEPCTVDVKRTASSATATAGITKPKSNAFFCVKQGTAVVWKSTQKNTGFVIDFGPGSPFEPQDTIIGGSNRDVSVTAKEPGCYKYSIGACVSGATYGMCGSSNAEAVVLPAQ
jgi:plastocyanin